MDMQQQQDGACKGEDRERMVKRNAEETRKKEEVQLFACLFQKAEVEKISSLKTFLVISV